MHKLVLIDFTHQIQKEFSRFNLFYACSVKKRFGQKNAISFIITYREKNRKRFFFSYEWRTRSNLNFPFFLLLRAFFRHFALIFNVLSKVYISILGNCRVFFFLSCVDGWIICYWFFFPNSHFLEWYAKYNYDNI